MNESGISSGIKKVGRCSKISFQKESWKSTERAPTEQCRRNSRNKIKYF
jgi:hypothetical protein